MGCEQSTLAKQPRPAAAPGSAWPWPRGGSGRKGVEEGRPHHITVQEIGEADVTIESYNPSQMHL